MDETLKKILEVLEEINDRSSDMGYDNSPLHGDLYSLRKSIEDMSSEISFLRSEVETTNEKLDTVISRLGSIDHNTAS
jgi:hypothetical protein